MTIYVLTPGREESIGIQLKPINKYKVMKRQNLQYVVFFIILILALLAFGIGSRLGDVMGGFFMSVLILLFGICSTDRNGWAAIITGLIGMCMCAYVILFGS